jgi:hypothetical protein
LGKGGGESDAERSDHHHPGLNREEAPAAGKGRRSPKAAEILFLMAEIARRNFAEAEERRWRVMAAYLVLEGRGRATRLDWARVDGELGR